MIRLSAVAVFRIVVHGVLLALLTIALSCLFAAAVRIGQVLP